MDKERMDVINQGFLKVFLSIKQFNDRSNLDSLLALQNWFEQILRETCLKHSYQIFLEPQNKEVI